MHAFGDLLDHFFAKGWQVLRTPAGHKALIDNHFLIDMAKANEKAVDTVMRTWFDIGVKQSAAGDMVSREAERFRVMSVGVSSAMAEQAAAVGQIAQAAEDMRRQSEQTTKGLAEQGRAAADIAAATHNVARQVALIVRANREQSDAAYAARETLGELRRLNEQAREQVRAAGVAGMLAGRARPSAPPDAGATGRR